MIDGPKRSQKNMKGFTILELLMATAVFSVVLVLVTMGIMQITRVYYKGVTESNTQNTARTIIDTVSQAIQFSGGDVTTTPVSVTPGTDYAFCVGNEQFTYRLGWQVENRLDIPNNQTWHALVQDAVADSGCGTTMPILTQEDVDGRDLVGEHMRLSDLSVQMLSENMYRVSVKVAYGEDDLFNGNATLPSASCKGQNAGSAFCSVAELSTIVIKRVQ